MKSVICLSSFELVRIITNQGSRNGQTTEVRDTINGVLASMIRRQRAINELRRRMRLRLSSVIIGYLEAMDSRFARVFIERHLNRKVVWIQPVLPFDNGGVSAKLAA